MENNFPTPALLVPKSARQPFQAFFKMKNKLKLDYEIFIQIKQKKKKIMKENNVAILVIPAFLKLHA